MKFPKICLLLLICATSLQSLWAQNDVEKLETSLKENVSVMSTSEELSQYQFKKLELESQLTFERERILEEKLAYDNFDTSMRKLEESLLLWKELTQSLATTNKETPEYTLMAAHKSELEESMKPIFLQLAKTLEIGPFTLENSFIEMETSLPSLQKKGETYRQDRLLAITKAEETRQTTILQIEEEIKNIVFAIEKLQHVQKKQLSDAVKRAITYVVLVVIVLLLQYILGKIVKKLVRDFSKSHQEAIWFTYTWLFRSIFILMFIFLFFREMRVVLPFLAVIVTGIGFALRDVLYSFFGWFMIGSDYGYQEGDMIETGGSLGKVFRITPFLTTIAVYGPQGSTGEILSFPNKIIFENQIKNLSRWNGFVLTSIDFMITYGSNLEHARRTLMETVGHRDLSLYYQSRHAVSDLKKMYGFHDGEMHPRIDVISDPKGIILRAKVFVRLDDIYNERTRITEEFLQKIATIGEIEMREV